MVTKVGERAPEFRLESDAGDTLSLQDFAGKWLVLYFYPRDSTPGCTREAQEFTRVVPRLRKMSAAVVGISKDSVKSHCSFRDKIGIKFPLLSDPDLVVHRAYRAWGTKTMYGKKVEGTIRSTFLISPAGNIVHVWGPVRVDGHVEEVLAILRAAREESAKSART